MDTDPQGLCPGSHFLGKDLVKLAQHDGNDQFFPVLCLAQDFISIGKKVAFQRHFQTLWHLPDKPVVLPQAEIGSQLQKPLLVHNAFVRQAGSNIFQEQAFGNSKAYGIPVHIAFDQLVGNLAETKVFA